MNTTISVTRLHTLKIAARCSVGFVWIYEGLVPKILHVSDRQICMVQSSGWWWESPEATLHVLGIAMIIAGLVIMSGWLEKLAQIVATVSVLVLMVLVIGNYPPALYDPFGGLAKDACLFTCSALVWMLSGKTGARNSAPTAPPVLPRQCPEVLLSLDTSDQC